MCHDETGKEPIGVRWVEANKGDDVNPNVRSRLVAMEFSYNKLNTVFAATPPWEAKKMPLLLATA